MTTWTTARRRSTSSAIATRLVTVDTTSGAFDAPSGYLLVVDIANPAAPVPAAAPIDLGGQPDSLKISPDGRYAAIAIENQRNEDLCVGGTLDGTEADEDDCVAGGGAPGRAAPGPAGIPDGHQARRVRRRRGCRRTVDLTGLARLRAGRPGARIRGHQRPQRGGGHAAGEQPHRRRRPADANGQEPLSGRRSHLNGVDAVEDGVISLTDVARRTCAGSLTRSRGSRVHSAPSNIATANEGDLFGGSRGFSIFRRNGSVAFDSGNSLEELAVQYGHYPEGPLRRQGDRARGDAVRAVRSRRLPVRRQRARQLRRGLHARSVGRPKFEQLLPGPLGPEGLLAIPNRNLLIVSGEVDLGGTAARSTVMIYQLKRGEPTYPQILSDEDGGSPIPWSALSGMVGVPGRPDSAAGGLGRGLLGRATSCASTCRTRRRSSPIH